MTISATNQRKLTTANNLKLVAGNLSLILSLLGLLFLHANTASACVGRTLYIGALQTPSETLMAEMLATLINERTGTTIQIRYFKDRDAIYTALKSNIEEKRADILVENTITALTIIGTNTTTPDKDFIAAKDTYENDFGVIWLNPFGFNNSSGKVGESISAPLVRRDVLTNFPLLPRILNKLAGVITNKVYDKLQAEVATGEKPKNVAKNFLKKRKLI